MGGGAGEKHFNWVIRRAGGGVSWAADPKHLDNLKSGYGKYYYYVALARFLRDGSEKVRDGRELYLESVRSSYRSIDILNDLAQDRQELSMATHTIFKQMPEPADGADVDVKRVMGSLQKYPSVAMQVDTIGKIGVVRMRARKVRGEDSRVAGLLVHGVGEQIFDKGLDEIKFICKNNS